MSKVTTINHLKEAVEQLKALIGTLATKTTEALEEMEGTIEDSKYTHPEVTAADTTSAEEPDYGGTVSVVDSVDRDSSGHVTGINVKTVTLPTACLTISCVSEGLTLESNCLTVIYLEEDKSLTLKAV